MKRPSIVVVALAASIAAVSSGCTRIKVLGPEFSPNADFASYETFRFMEESAYEVGDERIDNPITQKLLRGSIRQQLTAKGFRETDTEPDFLVYYHAVIVSKMTSSIKGRPNLGGYGAIYGYGREPWAYSAVDGYEQGTIVVDVVDPVSMRAVWRNAAQGQAAVNPTIDGASENIPKAVEKILAEFPPQS